MKIEFPGEIWKDYELVDSGNYEKLERLGRYFIVRPEPKALWDRSLSEQEWMRLCSARFVPGAGFSKAGKEDSGSWEKHKSAQEQWFIKYLSEEKELGFYLRLGLTSFKHVGVFPEQAPNWDYIYRETLNIVKQNKEKGQGDNPVKVLNLFAYTGAASLAAKAAGAQVTHLDSVKQVVSWARNNMEKSGMDNIRWVVEDAMKFVMREAKRGNTYQGIILDPPAYGHGPDGEKWKLDECLFKMLKNVAKILAKDNNFLVLNLYSNGFSAQLGETVLKEAFSLTSVPTSASTSARSSSPTSTQNSASTAIPTSSSTKVITSIESGELALRDRFSKVLPLSVFVRMKQSYKK